jgi:hypothetical protein
MEKATMVLFVTLLHRHPQGDEGKGGSLEAGTNGIAIRACFGKPALAWMQQGQAKTGRSEGANSGNFHDFWAIPQKKSQSDHRRQAI